MGRNKITVIIADDHVVVRDGTRELLQKEDDLEVIGEAGAAGYLLKDVRGQEVIEAVRAVHAGESVLHPVVARKVLNRFVRSGAREPGGQELTEREMEVLRMAARGWSNKEIAHELDLSVRTVQGHLGNIFNKLTVGSRTEAVISGLKKGLLTLEDISES